MITRTTEEEEARSSRDNRLFSLRSKWATGKMPPSLGDLARYGCALEQAAYAGNLWALPGQISL